MAVEDQSWLVDVSDMELRQILNGDDSTLAACLRRLVDDLDDPDGVISAFQSFASST